MFFISYSQTPIGFSVGSNFSYLTTDSSSMPIKYGKPGLNTGIFWNIPSGYNSFIEVGGFFSQQGAQFQSETFNNTSSFGIQKEIFTINSNIYYAKVPLIWKQTFGDWYTKLGFYGELAGYKISKWTKIHEFLDTNYTNTGTYGSFATNLRAFDIGMTMALGVQFNISSQFDFFINASYNIGFLNLTPNEIQAKNQMYNRYFTLSTGIIFNDTKYRFRK